MYRIKNIGGALSVMGLYPGETKKIQDTDLTESIIKLCDKGLVSISYYATPIATKKKEENNIVKDEVK